MDHRYLSSMKVDHLAKRSKTKHLYAHFQWLLTEDSLNQHTPLVYFFDIIFNINVTFPSFIVERRGQRVFNDGNLAWPTFGLNTGKLRKSFQHICLFIFDETARIREALHDPLSKIFKIF